MQYNTAALRPLAHAPLQRAPRSRGRMCVVSAAEPGLNKYSARITQPKSQGASQAMLYATGLKEEDMNKAQVWARDSYYNRIIICKYF